MGTQDGLIRISYMLLDIKLYYMGFHYTITRCHVILFILLYDIIPYQIALFKWLNIFHHIRSLQYVTCWVYLPHHIICIEMSFNYIIIWWHMDLFVVFGMYILYVWHFLLRLLSCPINMCQKTCTTEHWANKIIKHAVLHMHCWCLPKIGKIEKQFQEVHWFLAYVLQMFQNTENMGDMQNMCKVYALVCIFFAYVS